MQSQILISSGGDLILAVDLQGVGVTPQLYNGGLTPSFDMISHAIVMLPEYFPTLLSYSFGYCNLLALVGPFNQRNSLEGHCATFYILHDPFFVR